MWRVSVFVKLHLLIESSGSEWIRVEHDSSVQTFSLKEDVLALTLDSGSEYDALARSKIFKLICLRHLHSSGLI